MRLEKKVVVVTGAARGIGAAIASGLAREGAAVIAVDVLGEAVEQTVAKIRASGGQAKAIQADISTDAGNVSAVDAALNEYGGLDCLVANAAVQRFAKAADTTRELWSSVLDVNLTGAYLGCKAAIPHLIKRGGGGLIFTASVLGIVGDGDLAAYGAAKGGLRALCRSVAVAYGAQNIRCNTICPGDVNTEIFEDYVGRASDPVAELRRLEGFYPLGRVASPQEVANAAVFLASDDSSFITGIDLVVDGGLLAKVY